MSVINQVLLDLEKRRASGAERKVVPNHVRAMPPGVRNARPTWIAGLVVAALGLAALWASELLNGDVPPLAPPAPLFSEPAARAMAPAAAEAEPALLPEAKIASRLSFELSRIPEPLPEPAAARVAARPIPVARIVAKAEPEFVSAAAAREAPVAAKPAAPAAPPREPAADSGGNAARIAAAKPQPEIDKRVREPTARELAEAEYRKATAFLHQGRLEEARQGFEAALGRNPAHHGARQALLGLLVDTGRAGEAERIMREGVSLAPHQIGFAMALARLQLDRGDAAAAIATLEGSAPHAQASGDYMAFLAGLLQRVSRHGDAVEYFQAALRVQPRNGVWLLGLGMSLQATGRNAEAREAFQLARASANLSADLQAFADQRLRQLP